MHPSPASVTTKKFARRLFGLDAAAVSQFLGDLAAALDRLQANEAQLIVERDEARAALEAVKAQVAAGAQQAATLEARVAAYQAREASIAQTLILADETRREIEARAQTKAEATVATAHVDAREIVKAARHTAVALAEEARTLATHALEGARRVAEAKLALAEVESRLLIEESSAVAARLDHVTRQETATLRAHADAIVAASRTPTGLRPPADRLGELKSDLDRTKTLLQHLEATILSPGPTPRVEGDDEHR